MPKKINLAVIFGGPSGEHAVSLKSASEVMANLDQQKYVVLPIKISRKGQWDRNLLQNKIDLALIIGHGTFMEDGRLQAVLESYSIPYLFSGVLASALAMNKALTKIIARDAGLKVARGIVLKKTDPLDYPVIIKYLDFPIVIKPNELGSSVGTNIVKNEKDLKASLKEAFLWGDEVLLEEFISGRELTVAVLGRKNLTALPVVEIKPRISQWFDYAAKYTTGGSEEICPAQIPATLAKKAQAQATRIFEALGCRDLTRADFIWNEKNKQLYFLEINTIPGMTKTSITPRAALADGFTFENFLNILITTALEKN
ncbi:MAG: D-alanine--D-alanine ligase [Parcubacteria group bacterium]